MIGSRLKGTSIARNGGQRPTCLLVIISSSRALLTASILVALYYLMPLDLEGSSASIIVELAIGLIVFVGVMVWQVHQIAVSDNPALRALEGLFVALPLFLVLFAATYFLLSRADAATFNSDLSRTDSLYFTMTVFSTVGFGDITAKSEGARVLVTAQMALDLIIVGVGVHTLLNFVQRERDRLAGPARDPSSSSSAAADG